MQQEEAERNRVLEHVSDEEKQGRKPLKHLLSDNSPPLNWQKAMQKESSRRQSFFKCHPELLQHLTSVGRIGQP